ncbi:hypothetical protein NE237_004666 [Protea cynaroides]|uniref:6-phosphogluconate dehydrogenase NADP-binding domain-containing protein n=1 Tax=Protea cynaroides TaxID=273540 RepID=A0A9Q0KJB0_9MAGN|nr:hypothetical protein NE237_004666 [Protea cynaroides]
MVQPLLDMGARYAPSPLKVAAYLDVVFSIVGYPFDVQFVLIGSSRALQGLLPRRHLVDMTTSDPSLAVELKMREQLQNDLPRDFESSPFLGRLRQPSLLLYQRSVIKLQKVKLGF